MRPREDKTFTGFDLLCITGLGLVAVFAYMGISRAQVHELRRIEQHAVDIAAQATEISNIWAQLNEGKARMADLKAGLARLHRRIPDDLDTDEFLKDINSLAGRNDVLLVRVEPGEVVEKGSYREAPVAVEAQAGFRDFHTFVTALHEIPRLVRIEEIDIRATDGELHRVSLTLRIYAFKETDNEQQKKEHHSA